MFEDFESQDPQGVCSTFYRVVKMLCLLTAYVATLATVLLVLGFVFATLTR